MAERKRVITSALFYRTAWNTDQLADEYRRKADEMELAERGHECGHQWTISVSSIQHYSITGRSEHYDSEPEESVMKPVTVRAHNLNDALRKAAALPLDTWFEPEEEQ